MSEKTLCILILYEDESAWRRATVTQEHLRRELQDGPLLHFSCWKFRWLHHPKMLRMAMAQAESADLLLVFRRANGEPTAAVQRCFRAWLARRTTDCPGLLAVHETWTNQRHPARWSLSSAGEGNSKDDLKLGSRFKHQVAEESLT